MPKARLIIVPAIIIIIAIAVLVMVVRARKSGAATGHVGTSVPAGQEDAVASTEVSKDAPQAATAPFEKGPERAVRLDLPDKSPDDLLMRELVRNTPRIEEEPLAPEDVPASATVSYRAMEGSFNLVEYTEAVRDGGGKVELVTASTNRVVNLYEEDGRFDLQRNYFLVAIREEGKEPVIAPPGSDSLQLTLSVHPNGRSEVKQVSASDASAMNMGDGGFIEPEFPSRELKPGDAWEWLQEGVALKGEVEGFVSLQGRRCIKVKYAAAAPLPVKMTSGNSTMVIHRNDVSGRVYVDIDNGLQVAHEMSGYIDASRMRMTGYRLLVPKSPE